MAEMNDNTFEPSESYEEFRQNMINNDTKHRLLPCNEGDPLVTTFNNGSKWLEYFLEDDWKKVAFHCARSEAVYHREGDLPAFIHLYPSGSVQEVRWYSNGHVYRSNGEAPAITYYENGNKKCESWSNFDYEYAHNIHHNNNILMREQGELPTVITYYESGQQESVKHYWHCDVVDMVTCQRWLKYDESGNVLEDVTINPWNKYVDRFGQPCYEYNGRLRHFPCKRSKDGSDSVTNELGEALLEYCELSIG